MLSGRYVGGLHNGAGGLGGLNRSCIVFLSSGLSKSHAVFRVLSPDGAPWHPRLALPGLPGLPTLSTSSMLLISTGTNNKRRAAISSQRTATGLSCRCASIHLSETRYMSLWSTRLPVFVVCPASDSGPRDGPPYLSAAGVQRRRDAKVRSRLQPPAALTVSIPLAAVHDGTWGSVPLGPRLLP